MIKTMQQIVDAMPDIRRSLSDLGLELAAVGRLPWYKRMYQHCPCRDYYGRRSLSLRDICSDHGHRHHLDEWTELAGSLRVDDFFYHNARELANVIYRNQVVIIPRGCSVPALQLYAAQFADVPAEDVLVATHACGLGYCGSYSYLTCVPAKV